MTVLQLARITYTATGRCTCKSTLESNAIAADIEKAFSMIGIQENQRNKLRFLWLKDPYILIQRAYNCVFCRLVFGPRPSPSIQGATLTHHLDAHRDSRAELVEFIKKSLYVDDLLTGGDNVQEGFELYKPGFKGTDGQSSL